MSASPSISLTRLETQLLTGGRSPVDVVDHFGAMQGQDLPGVLTSIALRTPEKSVAAVIDDFNSGAIVRTWPQRGTLHVVSSSRVRDLLVVARERTFRTTVKRREALGIDEAVLEQARSIALEVVGDGITRADLTKAWEEAGVVDRPGRAYHLIFHLSLEGILVWGPVSGKGNLIVLLDRWVPEMKERSYDEAVDDIVTRCVLSHSPTTRKDISWWTSLPLRDVDRVLKSAGFEQRDGYVWAGDEKESDPDGLHLLPGFDEMILGYSDRAATVAPEYQNAICPGNNGVFKPTIVHGGQVIGTWQRAKREPTFFTPPKKALEKRVEKALAEVPLGA